MLPMIFIALSPLKNAAKDHKNQQSYGCPCPSKCGNQGIDRQCNDLAANS